MKWIDAITRVLEESKKPLHYTKITELIFEKHYKEGGGATPDATVNKYLGSNINTYKENSPFFKVGKGVFSLRKFLGNQDHLLTGKEKENNNDGFFQNKKEEDFYKPFAEWIVKELGECTKAIPLGGKIFKDKWGTPDVIGIREPRRGAPIKPPTEITSAEIKVDTNDLITAFGQACAYKLFSHKSYIVVPKTSNEEDIVRLDSLSRIFGIGLILFNNQSTSEPNFEIRVRALRNEPDMLYIDEYIRLVEKKLF